LKWKRRRQGDGEHLAFDGSDRKAAADRPGARAVYEGGGIDRSS
jgi:hypothetical protein